MLPADIVVIGLRGLAFAAALQAAGGPVFLRLFGRRLDRSLAPVRRLAIWSASAGLLFVSLHALVEPARLTGEFRGMFDLSLHGMLLASAAGTTLTLRLTGLALVLAGLLGMPRQMHALAIGGTLLIAASFAFMGHTATDDQRWLLAPLLIIHLLIVAFWFGGLWPLLCVARRESAAVAGPLIGEFSRYAARLVPLILLAGVAMAVLLLGSWSGLTSPYGFSLLGKTSAFALLMALAAANRWRFGPGIAAGTPGAQHRFQFTTLAEWGVILAVLMLTAVMTSLFTVHQ